MVGRGHFCKFAVTVGTANDDRFCRCVSLVSHHAMDVRPSWFAGLMQAGAIIVRHTVNSQQILQAHSGLLLASPVRQGQSSDCCRGATPAWRPVVLVHPASQDVTIFLQAFFCTHGLQKRHAFANFNAGHKCLKFPFPNMQQQM
jgi:hypothetical protein